MRAVRTERHKLIKRYDKRNKPVLCNCDAGPSKDVWLKHGWADMAPVDTTLYDLIFDPGETCNLATDPRHAETLADLERRLRLWMEATDDPLLQGDVPLPASAMLNARDALNAASDPLLPTGTR